MSRLDNFRQMVAKNPANALYRFGLANEAMKEGLWEEAREQLESYLGMHEDEGNGWSRLAEALTHLGRTDEAKTALRRGIEVSRQHGHPGMAAELEERLEELG